MFTRPRSTTFFAWLIAALMVATQTFAAVHGIVHADRYSNHEQAKHAHEDCDDHQHGQTNSGELSLALNDLFSSHQHESDCRLFDQASHDGAALKLHAVPLPLSAPPLTVAIFQGEALARWAALFDARGPPLTF